MDLSAQLAIRDMSYRKPVPVYVPTPPSSPYMSLVSPNGPSLSLDSATQDGTPPLPDDWREAIEQASTGNTSTAVLPTYVAAGSRPMSPMSPMSPLYNVPLNEPISSISSVIPRSYSCVNVAAAESSTSRATGSSRRPHLNYRPPTPPLQAHCKRQRVADDDTRCVDTMIPFHIVYPDTRSPHGNQAGYEYPAMQNLLTTPRRSPAASSLTTLATERILKTEKAQFSNGGTDPTMSTTWLGSLSTSNSTLGGDIKRVKSWLHLRVPSRYASGTAHRCSNACHYDAETKSHASASFWERMGVLGRVFRVGQGGFSVSAPTVATTP